VFTRLLVETVFKKHIEEILSDPVFVEEIIFGQSPTSGNGESSLKPASALAKKVH
jgi:hypothetical protein